ncbi:lipoprotein [Spiroplasma taiwanense]|uniref:MOLPALP family lipoprotein n=1 Tax=Spiroplasma taiwanense CT-1 TaxID=1276220 RepID=S5M063_9MOLU|nr:lipoprotein [Spiroplasma taiwanense]AGR41392.1 hypothetical protein STAIW_v1c08040 [Spiroplasma taiwanense CT-1]
MKRLLSLLASLSIITSTSITVIACETKTPKEDETFDQEKMKEFLGEVSKSLYLNKSGYNIDYVLETYSFKSNQKSLTSSELKEFKEKYFKNGLIGSNLKTTGFEYTKGQQPGDKDLLLGITTVANSIFSLSGQTDEEKAESLKTTLSELLKYFNVELTPETIKEAGPIIDQVANSLESFGDALSMEKYQNMTWTQTINLSFIGIANGLKKLVKDSTADFNEEDISATNFKNAMQNLELSLTKLRDKKIVLDETTVLSNLDSIAKIVNFARICMLYLSNFIVSDQFEVDLTAEQVNEFRNKKISTIADSNILNFKEMFEKVKETIFGSNSSTNAPIALKNVLKLLFLNTTQDYYKNMIFDLSDIDLSDFSEVIQKIIQSLQEFQKDDFVDGDLGFNYAMTRILNGSIDIKKLLDSLPDMFKGIIEALNLNIPAILVNLIGKIASNTPITKGLNSALITLIFSLLGVELEDSKIQKLVDGLNGENDVDLLNLLWNEDFLGAILGKPANESWALKNLLEKPLSSLLGINNILEFEFIEGAETLKEIVELIFEKIQNAEEIKIDFTAIGSLLKKLAPIFKDMPTSVDALVNKIKEAGILADLYQVKDNLIGLKDLLKYVQDTVADQKAKMIENIKTEYNKLTVANSEIISQEKYKYNLGSGKTVTISIAKENNLWAINQVEITG